MNENTDPPSENHRITTGSAWADALKELEQAAPQPKAAAPATPAPTAPVAKPAPARPASAPARNQPVDQLRALITKVSGAHSAVKVFEKAHPYLVAPNIVGLWEVHLKESAVMLQRELERIERG
jgi:hypothetical protein